MSAVVTDPPELPASTIDGEARAEALRGHRPDCDGVGTVNYVSRGRLLVMGDPGVAVPCVRILQADLSCILLAPPGSRTVTDLPPGTILVEGRLTSLEGHLGAFRASIDCNGETLDPGMLFDPAAGAIDLVLDLAERPFLAQELPPPGYYAPVDTTARQRAMDELRDLVGEFEKPRYFQYDASICAHGRSGLSGCRRCLDACPTLAIRSLGEMVEVDPFLCQGGGGCATACPTGAIRYAYPGVAGLLTSVRDALVRYREAGGRDPQVLFYDGAGGDRVPEVLARRLPESVLPFRVEEIGSVGMETWLAALAYGARRVVLFTTHTIPRVVLREMSLQLSYARGILVGMGYRPDAVTLVVDGDRNEEALAALGAALPMPDPRPGSFMPFDEKRITLDLAIAHLHARAPQPRPLAGLPDDAPYGAIAVDGDRCTLCMACVSVCPAHALYAGNDRPALEFIEASCVQCGLCHAACPEDAVRLVPRMNYIREESHAIRTLHEQAPFPCERCGRPFATRAVIERMTERLAEHWMFRDERARRRIRMCQDCRVLDVFEAEGRPNVYDKPTADA